jgi:hypothetical protein
MNMFTVETREFGWDDVVIAAQVWGEWADFVETVRNALACLRFATKTERLPSSAQMRETANAFRYARNLISGEETRVWLETWGMNVELWMDCLRGQYLRQLWAVRLKEIGECHRITDGEVAAQIRTYAVCEGKLEQWAHKLAGRAAVAASKNLLRDESLSARQLIKNIEAEFQLSRATKISPKLIEAKIAAHRLDWIHYECRCLWLSNEKVAREAAWCVSEDGLTLDQVAVEAKGELRQWSFYADEIETSVRPYFLAARQGDLLGPWKLREKYPLFSLLNKRLPQSNDPHVVTRAEQAIVSSILEQAVNERVKWIG